MAEWVLVRCPALDASGIGYVVERAADWQRKVEEAKEQ